MQQSIHRPGRTCNGRFQSSLQSLAILCLCFVCGGATCARRSAPAPFPPPPVAFEETPSLEQIAQVVNRTANIQQLSSNSASVDLLSMPRVPKLRATLNLQREKRFRLRGRIPIVMGSGFDLGSNEEVFWFEVPEGMTRTLYYARHDQYRQQLERAILPVDPTWISDALGLVQIDPVKVIAGPIVRPDGKLEIRSSVPSPAGIYQRICLIDAQGGFVTDQLLYAPDGTLVAQSSASQHKHYPEQQCVLPHSVELQLAPKYGPPLAMRIEIGSYTVNQLLSGDPQLFTMPNSASQAVDLVTLGQGESAPAVPQSINAVPSAASSPSLEENERPRPNTMPAQPIHYRMVERPPLPQRGAELRR